MSDKRISPLRQRMIQNTPAAVVFMPTGANYGIIQSVPLLTIECLRSAGSQQLLSTLNHQEFAMTRSDADAAIILTSSPKPFPVGQRRDFSLIKNGFARCGSKIVERAHRARVVCVLFLSCLTR